MKTRSEVTKKGMDFWQHWHLTANLERLENDLEKVFFRVDKEGKDYVLRIYSKVQLVARTLFMGSRKQVDGFVSGLLMAHNGGLHLMVE